jgi:hypothetical protein
LSKFSRKCLFSFKNSNKKPNGTMMLRLTLWALALFIGMQAASGAMLTVNLTIDGLDTDVGTLRWAISRANSLPGLDQVCHST